MKIFKLTYRLAKKQSLSLFLVFCEFFFGIKSLNSMCLRLHILFIDYPQHMLKYIVSSQQFSILQTILKPSKTKKIQNKACNMNSQGLCQHMQKL